MNDVQKFGEVLLAAGMVFNKDIPATLVKIYLRALEPYTPLECAGALEQLISTSKFMPKPADIREALEGDARGQALESWREVERLMRNCVGARSEDDVTQAVVISMGGWRTFGMAQERELPFLKREYLERYENYKRSPALLTKAVEALGYKRGVRRIGGQREEMQNVSESSVRVDELLQNMLPGGDAES